MAADRVLLALRGLGTMLLTTLYGIVDIGFIPKVFLGISFSGIVVSASCYLYTEFALRPVAALRVHRDRRAGQRGRAVV